ncbi:MAG: LCP family protein [Bacilli bacterium]
MKKKVDIEKVLGYFSKFLFCIIIFFFIGLIICAIKANMLPLKYIFLLIITSIGISILFWYLLWPKHSVIYKLGSSVFGILVCIICFIGILALNNTFDFIKNLLSKEYESINYNVVVLKSMNFNTVDDLQNETLGLLNENSDNVIENLSKNLSFNDSIASDVGSLLDGLYNYTFKAIVISNDVLAMLQDEDNSNYEENSENKINFEEITKVIYTFTVKTKVSNENVEVIDIDEPFAIYISGIDQYGNIKTIRGRSDVNIIMIVNPKTNKILLVNTPRDYYVALHGKTGLRDKLTHAGVYGIDLSMSTLEDLYGMKINYYLRVNFDTVIELVDVIDGIEVESDMTFNSSHIKGWTVKKGINYMDGKKALAYSRERYAYVTGDRHRGKNQQDVINAIISKVSKSKILLTKYNKIIDSLDGSFQTNMPTKTIQNFIKYQLDKMPDWNVESISVSGSDAYDYTYSYGTRQKLYVMVPYEKDIKAAKEKIKEVIDGE